MLTFEDIYKGKSTLIKNNEYFSTKAYVEPFVEKMSKYTDNFIIKGKLPDQITTTNGEADNTYNRVWVQAVLPKKYWEYENHQQSVSLLYALDTRKPIYKIFKNPVNMACLNMCVFQPEFIQSFELEPEKAMNYKFADIVMELSDKSNIYLDKLVNEVFEYDSMQANLGSWVEKAIRDSHKSLSGSVKLSTESIINTYKNVIIDPKSKYFVEEGQDVSLYNVYNAFTDYVCNKKPDVTNTFEKVQLFSEFIELY